MPPTRPWLQLDGRDLQDLLNSLKDGIKPSTEPEPEEVCCSKNKLPGSVKSQEAESLLTKHFGCVYESYRNGDNMKVTHQASGISFSMPNWRPEVGILYIQTQLAKIGYTRKDLSNAWFNLKNGINGTTKQVTRIRVICTGRGFGYEVFSSTGIQIALHDPCYPTQDQALLAVSDQWGPLQATVVVDIYKATERRGISLQLQRSIIFGKVKTSSANKG